VEGEQEQKIKEKIKFFLTNKISIHIIQLDGIWKNGSIIEVKANCFVLDELKEGKQLIFYSDIYNVIPLKEKVEE
jgi:hypothetical protein